MLSSTFLDDKEIAGRIYEMLANDILGKGQLEKSSYVTMICPATSSNIPRTRRKIRA